MLDNQKLIQSVSRTLVQKLAEMSQLSQSLRTSLEQETKNIFAVQENEHSGHTHQLNTHFSTVQALLKKIKSQQRVEDEKLVLVEKELQSAASALNEEVSAWRDSPQLGPMSAKNRMMQRQSKLVFSSNPSQSSNH